MKKNVVVVAVLLIAVLLACVGCSPEPKLQGTFVNEEAGTVVFDGNGNFTMSTQGAIRINLNGTYTVSGSTVTVSFNLFGTQQTDSLTWSGNTLTDSNGVVYTKQ